MIGEVIFPVLIPFRKIAIWVTKEWVQDLQTSFCQFNELIEVWGTQFFTTGTPLSCHTEPVNSESFHWILMMKCLILFLVAKVCK